MSFPLPPNPPSPLPPPTPPTPPPPTNYVLPLSMRFLRTIGGVGCGGCTCCGSGCGGNNTNMALAGYYTPNSAASNGGSADGDIAEMINEPNSSNHPNNLYNDENENHDTTTTNTTANNTIVVTATTNNNNNNNNNNSANTGSNINNKNHPMPRQPRTTLPWSIMEQILLDYHHTCRLYACDVDIGILTTLRFHPYDHTYNNNGGSHQQQHQQTLTISNSHFSDAHLLAICDVLLKYGNGPLSYISHYDFSRGGGGGNRLLHHHRIGGSRYEPSSWDVVATTMSNNTRGGKSRHATTSTGFGSHGAIALAQWIRISRYMTELNIDRNPSGPAGAAVIFQACTQNTALLKLSARRCQVNEGGALAFVTTILAQQQEQYDTALIRQQGDANYRATATITTTTTTSYTPPCGRLVMVDLSANRIGYRGCMAIDVAMTQLQTSYSSLLLLQQQQQQQSNINSNNNNHQKQLQQQQGTFQIPPLLQLDMEGNLVLQEVMNSITHGCGIILAVIASVIMMNRVLRRQDDNHYASTRHVVSCTIYSISLIVLYTSSTLYHSFFTLRHTKYVFEVIDKCAIYILIAGSYTPFLQIVLSRHTLYSYGLLSFLWLLCGLGVTVEFMYPIWKYKGRFSLFMFLCMGWSALICIPEVARIIPSRALHLMTLGGLSYTAGVPFFVRNNSA